MSKTTPKKILSQVADVDRSLAVGALVVVNRGKQIKTSKDDSKTKQLQRNAAERRLAYVRAIGNYRNLNELLVAISEVARQRGEFPSPSITTILRWRCLINSDGALPLPLRSGIRRSRKNLLYED